MKRLLGPFLLIVLFSSIVNAQTATIWGPGDEYEIDYLHSGNYIVNGSTKLNFENEPTTEFTLHDITNEGYDYTYVGYGGIVQDGSISMVSFNFGGTSFTFPFGDMPVALPLSYGEEDDWIPSFSQTINELSSGTQGDFGQANQFVNASSRIRDGKMVLDFEFESNSSSSLNSVLFTLPDLIISEYQGQNATYVNTTVTGQITYQLNTGVLFTLDITLVGEDLLLDDISQGPVSTFQGLEFVTIIPPVSIIDDALNLNLIFGLISVTFLLVIKRIRN